MGLDELRRYYTGFKRSKFARTITDTKYDICRGIDNTYLLYVLSMTEVIKYPRKLLKNNTVSRHTFYCTAVSSILQWGPRHPLYGTSILRDYELAASWFHDDWPALRSTYTVLHPIFIT